MVVWKKGCVVVKISWQATEPWKRIQPVRQQHSRGHSHIHSGIHILFSVSISFSVSLSPCLSLPPYPCPSLSLLHTRKRNHTHSQRPSHICLCTYHALLSICLLLSVSYAQRIIQAHTHAHKCTQRACWTSARAADPLVVEGMEVRRRIRVLGDVLISLVGLCKK